MKKRSTLFAYIASVGIALAVLSTILGDAIPKQFSGMLLGLGCGMLGLGGSNWRMKRWEEKDPDLMRQSEIEVKDERNVAIRNRAKAVSGEIINWGIMGLAWLSIGLNAPLWITLLLIGIFLLQELLSLCLVAKYQKEM